MHAAFLLLKDGQDGGAIASHIEPIHRLAILVASLGLDAGHPGTTNEFEVATQSELAMQYNDTSVLENYST